MKRLSFIIPLYNMQEYISCCIDSILLCNLSREDYEILVWNDGSTDSSLDIVENYAKEEQCIKVITEENHGVSYSRNHALQMAKGRYVWFVDSDDEVVSENVDKILSLAENQSLQALLFNWQVLTPAGEINDGINQVTDISASRGRDLYLSRPLNMAPWSFLYEREFLLAHNLQFPEDFKTCEDIQFNQKVLFLADKVGTSSLPGYLYRHRLVSTTKSHGDDVVSDQIRRIQNEIEYFSPYKDHKFLTEIIYRNLREINVWLFWSESPEKWFGKIKDVTNDAQGELQLTVGVKSLFIQAMRITPKSVFMIQKKLNILKRKLKGQYVKQ